MGVLNMKILENGKIVETDIVLDDTMTENSEVTAEQHDRVQQLMEGLSTATTIAQIRAVAQSILDETEGDAV